MYYVVDQSNPKEPMEYIRVTRKDIYELKNVQIHNFIGKPINDDEISLCQYVLEDIEVPSYYDTKPVRIGTMYTHLLNIYHYSENEDYKMNFYNDIDFILFLKCFQTNDYNNSFDLIYREVIDFLAEPTTVESGMLIAKYISNVQLKKETSQNIFIYSNFYNDFTNIESTPIHIFKKFMIHALIHFISTSNYTYLFKSNKVNDLFQGTCCDSLTYTDNHPFFSINKCFLNTSQNSILSTENIHSTTLLAYLKQLHSKYESSLYIDDVPENICFESTFNFLLEIYSILYLYSSMNIEVSNYNDLFSKSFEFPNSKNFSFDKYEKLTAYKTDFYNNNSIDFERLSRLLHNLFNNDKKVSYESIKEFNSYLDQMYNTFNYSINMPIEYVFMVKTFIHLTKEIIKISTDSKHLKETTTIDIKSIIEDTIVDYQNKEFLFVDCLDEYNYADDPPNFDIAIYETENYMTTYKDTILSKIINNQIIKDTKLLYYNLNIHNIIDLFKPAIESYLLFSKHPIDRCSHCHMFFLKTSPNRKFCDSALTLESGMTCKEEREEITDQKSLYQKTTNDFNQYLQKIILKGGKSYTLRVYNILEKNKYFDTIKPKGFDKLSKTDKKDLLWVLNSFFNYSYAIMESMNFQKIVKDPTFKDIRYYNNYLYEYTGYDEEPFTSTAYTDLFEEYKKYTRTNKARTNKDTRINKDSNTTEIINIYDSLVKFSESKNSELSFKTIRSKSMQDLNEDDVAKLFEITEIVIHIFFLRLSDWYLEGIKDKPDFTYAFPEEFATSKIVNILYINKNANDNDNFATSIQYMKQEDIKSLEYKINDAENSDIYEDVINTNKDRENQVIKLIKELKEKIFDNHPVK